MSLDFNNLSPWKDIADVTVDGEAMVWIPKFYIQTGTYSSGDYNGCKYWKVSKFAKSGFRIHPAFVYNGVTKNGFYIGKYFAYNKGSNVPGSAAGQNAWTSISYDNAKAYIAARNTQSTGAKAGWHLKTIYEWSAIQMLMLMEMGHPDMQTLIGAGSRTTSGNSNAKWRGLCDLWSSVWEWTDGCYSNSSNVVSIFKNTNDGTYVSTGQTAPTGRNWIKDVSSLSGTNFNCGDVFIPSELDSQQNATFSDYMWSDSGDNYLMTCGPEQDGNMNGLFAWCFDSPANRSDSIMGFRLAKYDI